MNWFEPSQPKDIKPVPWLSPEAIGYLKIILQPGWRVLEFGGGGSTLWLAPKVKEIVTVETDKAWYAELLKRQTENMQLILWEKMEKIPKIKGKFEMMIIDGEPVEKRILFLQAAESLVKPGGWVVLDNYNRSIFIQERMKLLKYAARFQRINSVSGTYLNTEFIQMNHYRGEGS
jgi:predicted O-methyltransferase YrrM